MIKTALYMVSLLCIISCGETDRIPADAPGYVNGKAVHPTIKIGRPYRVKGRKYYPEYEPDYDETGEASWYGPNFHGKMTANGEKYNQWAMTAAHPTLPMPSMVKVTALDTGRSIVVRINDRGPFANGRIIDLSRAAAEELGVRAKGIAKVRVQYLKPETEQYIAKLQLKKPDAWKEVDLARAEAAKAPPPEPVKLARLPVPMPPPTLREPVQAVELAAQVPERFAYEDSGPLTTTIDVRGVTMEEFGYAEDAFSVLSEEDYGESVAYSAPQLQSPAVLPPEETHAPGKQYYVQAATFGHKNNAIRMAEKLRAIADVRVVPTSIGAQGFWKVVLGPAFNRGIANEIKRKLTDYAIYDAVLVEE